MVSTYPSTAINETSCISQMNSPTDDANAETSEDLAHQHLAEIISSTISRRTAHFDVPSISPLSGVRISEYASMVIVPRHRSNSALPPNSDYSPYSSYPSTAVNSRAPSPMKELDEDEDDFGASHDCLNWRLASGFFALFVGGWADGGKRIPMLSKYSNKLIALYV